MKKHVKKLAVALVVAGAAVSMDAEAKSMDQGKLYGAARVGYGWTKYSDSTNNLKANGKGVLGSVAFGYNASNNVRGEIEAYFDDGVKSKKNANNLKANVKTYGGLLNGYYDFKNQSTFTPYITAGIGYMHNKATETNTATNVTFKGKKNTFAWQAGLGVGFEAARNVNLELGYRLFQKSTAKLKVKNSANANQTSSLKVKFQHTVLAGVRVNF